MRESLDIFQVHYRSFFFFFHTVEVMRSVVVAGNERIMNMTFETSCSCCFVNFDVLYCSLSLSPSLSKGCVCRLVDG